MLQHFGVFCYSGLSYTLTKEKAEEYVERGGREGSGKTEKGMKGWAEKKTKKLLKLSSA